MKLQLSQSLPSIWMTTSGRRRGQSHRERRGHGLLRKEPQRDWRGRVCRGHNTVRESGVGFEDGTTQREGQREIRAKRQD